MLRKSKCRKCIHCIWEDLDSYIIKCEKFGTTNKKYMCRYYITEKEKNLLKKLEMEEK
jgi:hypothetical protein